MAVISVLTLRVHPGKTAELLETLKAVKRVVEKAGGRYRVLRQVFGPTPNALNAVSEFPDWSGLAKMRSDPDMQQIMARVRDSTSPAAEPIAAAIVEEISL